MHERDGEVSQGELSEIAEEKNRRKKGCIFAVIAVLLIFGWILFEVYKTMIPTDYWIFTEERIHALEQEYNMDLSSADLERYWVPALAQDNIEDRFCFSIRDEREFMENHYFGKIVASYESDDGSFAGYKCKPYVDSEDRLKARFIFLIEFQKNGEKYDADLTSYYE